MNNKPVALITGASRGIGKAIAIAAANKGYDIAFCYQHSQQAAEALSAELKSLGANVVAMQLDVADEEQVSRFFSTISDEFGRLDLLVNNAGQTKDGLLATMSLQDMQAVLNTNVIGVMLFCREALSMMIPAKVGNIVNISSISATKPNKGQCNYAASKGAVEAMTRALAVEVAKKNIRVNCVAPGVISTEMVGDLLGQYEKTLKSKMLAKKIGQPEDIANAVMFLADPKNHYMTGEVLHVNGGLTLG